MKINRKIQIIRFFKYKTIQLFAIIINYVIGYESPSLRYNLAPSLLPLHSPSSITNILFSCLWNSGPFLRGHFFLSSLSNLKSLKMAPLPRRQRLECRMNGMGVVTIILCQPKTFGEQFVVVGFRSYMSNVAVQFCSHKPTKQWTTRSGGSPMGERGAREKRTDEGNCWIWHFFYWLYWGKVFLHLINGVMRTHVPLSCCLPCLSCRLWDFMCCSVEMGLF